MVKRLDPFLPPEETLQHETPRSLGTQLPALNLWLMCLLIGGSLKIYQCLPVSFGLGTSAYAEGAQKEAAPSEGGGAAQPQEPNPMLIGLDEVQILQKLKERRSEIDAASAAQEKKSQELKLLNDIMQKSINDLTQIKATLDSQSKSLQKEPQEALQKMAKLYEGMKAGQAAKILEDMETAVVSQIVGLMKKQLAANVIAALSDKKARSVTLHSLKIKASAESKT